MNTLLLIKKQIMYTKYLHSMMHRFLTLLIEALSIMWIVRRSKETHGTYCYRGHVYNNMNNYTYHYDDMDKDHADDLQRVINSNIERVTYWSCYRRSNIDRLVRYKMYSLPAYNRNGRDPIFFFVFSINS